MDECGSKRDNVTDSFVWDDSINYISDFASFEPVNVPNIKDHGHNELTNFTDSFALYCIYKYHLRFFNEFETR